MTYDRFRAVVEAMMDEIPPAFLTDLQGVHALRDEKPEDGFDDVWRMGEYLDPGPDSFLGGDEGLGRHVALYWGSFRRIAENDPEFDWEEEIWETLTHELQHHVESLAGDGRLIAQDLIDAESFFAYEDDDEDPDALAEDAAANDDPAHDDPAGEPRDAPDGRGSGRDPHGDAPGGGLGGWLRRLLGGG